jgi:hypothetical protein
MAPKDIIASIRLNNFLLNCKFSATSLYIIATSTRPLERERIETVVSVRYNLALNDVEVDCCSVLQLIKTFERESCM